MPQADFKDILDAFELIGSGDLIPFRAVIHMESGAVFAFGEGLEEEEPADIETGPYLDLPDKIELDLGGTSTKRPGTASVAAAAGAASRT